VREVPGGATGRCKIASSDTDTRVIDGPCVVESPFPLNWPLRLNSGDCKTADFAQLVRVFPRPAQRKPAQTPITLPKGAKVEN
jgi:hypothetical protein